MAEVNVNSIFGTPLGLSAFSLPDCRAVIGDVNPHIVGEK